MTTITDKWLCVLINEVGGVARGETKMTVVTTAYEAQLQHEILRCHTLIKRLETVQIDVKALDSKDLRETVADCLDTAIQALQDERTKMQYELDHPLRD